MRAWPLRTAIGKLAANCRFAPMLSRAPAQWPTWAADPVRARCTRQALRPCGQRLAHSLEPERLVFRSALPFDTASSRATAARRSFGGDGIVRRMLRVKPECGEGSRLPP